MSDVRGISVPWVVLGAGATWAAAIGLLLYTTIFGQHDHIALWAVLVIAVASAWTVIAAQCMGRRKTVEAIAHRIAVETERDRLSRI